MMDESKYASSLNVAVKLTLQCLDAALQGKDSQEGAAAPYRLAPCDLKAVRQHLAAVEAVVGSARLVPTKAVRAERDERADRGPYARR